MQWVRVRVVRLTCMLTESSLPLQVAALHGTTSISSDPRVGIPVGDPVFHVTRRLKMRRFSKNSVLRYGLKCKLIGSLVKLGFRQKTINKHLMFHITNLQLRECIAKGVYLVVL